MKLFFFLFFVANIAYAVDPLNEAIDAINKGPEIVEFSDNKAAEMMPNYTTSSPETSYYDNSASLESDGQDAFLADENSQLMLDSYNEAQNYRLTGNEQFIKNAQNNSEAVIITDSYEDCQTPPPTVTEQHHICEYSSVTREEQCEAEHQTEVAKRYNYQCLKQKPVYQKSCQAELNVSCDRFVNNLDVIGSTIPYSYTTPNLFLGQTNTDYLGQNCNPGYAWSFRFNLPSLNHVDQFKLISLRFDDLIEIYINNQLVYAAPQTIASSKRCEYYGGSTSPNKDLRNYLIQGENRIDIKLLVGGRGDLRVNFALLYQGCAEFTESWLESC